MSCRQPANSSNVILSFPLPLTAAAHQIFLAAAAAGHGGEDDSAVIKTYPGIELPKDRREER